MRRPFIIFLLIISIYCWLTDCINFLFYLFHISGPTVKTFSTVISIVILAASFLLLKKAFKNLNFPGIGDLFQIKRKREWLLLLTVSSPIILLGLFRAIYPDQNYDTYHFELYLQELDFTDNKTNFAAGSIRTYYFTLSERIFALFRHILGFRLGSILNTVLLVTIIFSIYDFIKKVFAVHLPHIQFPSVLVALLSLFAIFADNTLFNTGSYKPDILGVPLILELVHIIFFRNRATARKIHHFYFFLIVSLTVTCKLTYLPYAGIATIIYIIQYFKIWSKKELLIFPLLILTFPGIYLVYNLIQTGNPIFPFYNKLFHSAQYPNQNFKDLRWGHKALYEIFIYPIVTWLDKSRCNEWGLYSYRLLTGYFVSLVTVVCYLIGIKKNKHNSFFRFMVHISVLTILFDYACIVTTGFYRYGTIVEVMYGLIISLWFLYLNKKILSFFLFVMMFLQSYSTFNNIFKKNLNLSWHDYPELLRNRAILKNNAGLILNDYGHIIDSSGILNQINGFVNADPYPQDGLAKLLKRDATIYDLEPWARTPELMASFEKNVVRPRSEKEKLVTVASIDALNAGILKSLNKRGYLVSNMYEVYPDFVKYGEPVFLLQIKYLDTSKYKINATEQYLRDENPGETRNNFSYNTGNKLKAFIREAPFAFAWDFLPGKYEISINGNIFTTKNRFGRNKILSAEGTELNVHKPNSVPYLIIVQEIIEK